MRCGLCGHRFDAAALAALLWGLLDEGVARSMAYNVVIMAGVTTLLFNANPLMRFDGYYVLSDLLEIPNLYSNGARHLASLAQRYLLGLRSAAAPDLRDREAAITLAYGVCSLAWRALIYASLFSAASVLFRGAGLTLACVAVLAMIVPPAARFYRYLRDGGGLEAPSPKVYVPRLALAVAGLAFVLLAPLKPLVKAPAVLQIQDHHVLRAECPGFVRTVLVRDNERVKAGQLLVELENPDEALVLRKLKARVSRQEVKTRHAYSKREIAAMKGEMAALEAFQAQLAEKEAYLATLRVSAPADGVVIAPRIAELPGRYLRTGEDIVGVGVLPAREVRAAVPQGEVEHFRAQVGLPVRVKVAGRSGAREAVLESVSPRAARDIPHAALSSLAGGPLPVVRRREASPRRSYAPEGDFELIAPVFVAKARLGGDAPEGLAAGERAFVRFRSRLGLPLWKRLYQAVERRIGYLRDRRAATGA